jgi:uncharacterized protein (DUF39 family)
MFIIKFKLSEVSLKVPKGKASKTIAEINKRIKQGKAVVVTADEMTDIVKQKGPEKASREIDVVTTGTFAPMCSSGAFINFGHSKPTTKAMLFRGFAIR